MDEAIGTETTTSPADKPGLTHKSLGLRLLQADPSDIKQRDVERLMSEFNKQKQGDSQAEYNGKMLRAALACGNRWIKEIEPSIEVKDVDGLSPKVVRWFVNQIDALYREVTVIPPN